MHDRNSNVKELESKLNQFEVLIEQQRISNEKEHEKAGSEQYKLQKEIEFLTNE